VVIATIGKDQQSPARITGVAAQVVHCHFGGIEKRGRAARDRVQQAALNLPGIVRKRDGQTRARAEFHQEKLVLRVGEAQKLADSLAGLLQFTVHALTGIEYDANGERGILAGKFHNLLFRLVVEDAECAAVQSENCVVSCIRHVDRNQNQVTFGPEIRAGRRRPVTEYGRSLQVIRARCRPGKQADRADPERRPKSHVSTQPLCDSSVADLGLEFGRSTYARQVLRFSTVAISPKSEYPESCGVARHINFWLRSYSETCCRRYSHLVVTDLFSA